jgi:hypothetical protein
VCLPKESQKICDSKIVENPNTLLGDTVDKEKEKKIGHTGPLLICPLCKVAYNTDPIFERSRLEICSTCGETFWVGSVLVCHWDFEFLKEIMNTIQQLLPQVEKHVKTKNGGT